MRHSPNNHKVVPVFVGGTGRSGTTIMGDLLSFHQDIRTSVPIEIRFLAGISGLLQLVFGRNSASTQRKIGFFNVRSRRRRWISKRKNFKKIQKEFINQIWNSWWDIDAPPPQGRGLHSGISKEKFETLVNRLLKELRINRVWAARRFMRDFIYAQDAHEEKKYWVETNPLNIAQARRLKKIFPDALFINMVRDPRDVIASLLTKNWGPTTPLEGIKWIDKRLTAAHEALREIPAKHQITIALEDLAIHKREQTYKSLLTFLKLEDEALMQEFFRTQLTAQAAASGRWREEISTPEFFNRLRRIREKTGIAK